jgi:hypothetical protein
LRPDDQLLEIVIEGPMGHFVADPDPDIEVRGFTRLSEAVALLTITNIQGESHDDGSIQSLVTAAVGEALKDTTGLLVTGGTMAFRALGGEVTVGAQRVRLSYEAWHALQVGSTYLAVLANNRYTNGFRLYQSLSLEVKGSAISKVQRVSDPGSRLDKQSLQWTIDRIKQHAHLRRPQ